MSCAGAIMFRSDFYLASSSLLRHALLYPALSADEEHQLAVDGRAGSSSASERIILCNLRLAVSIARDYIGLGLTLDDLVSEGSIGLMKAASKFDPYHRVRFATYASFWVRHTILRALYNQNRLIRLPAHVVTRLLKVKQVLERMTEELGREPNRAELAAETGLRTNQITDLLAASAIPLSLHAPHGEENGTLEDFIADEQAANPALRQEDTRSVTGIASAAEIPTPAHQTRTDHPDHPFWNRHGRRGIVRVDRHASGPDLGTRAPIA